MTSRDLLTKFWRTRVAVLHGVPLHDHAAAERSTQGLLLGPWAFALCSGFIAAIPSAALGLIFHSADGLTPSFGRWDADFIETYNSQWSLLGGAVGVASFVSATHICAWLSLYRRDSTPQRRKVARSAYLYSSSAFGFWLALIVGLFAIFSDRVLYEWSPDRLLGGPTDSMLAGLLAYLVGSLVLLVWVWKIHATRVPADLFHANGYPRSDNPTPRPLREIQIGPWTKYRIFAPLAVLAASTCITEIVSTILVATTSVQLWLVHLVT